MDPLSLLWIDFTERGAELPARGVPGCRIRTCRPPDPGHMPLCECESPPDLLCFDFDRPRPETLRALQRTKRDYPALPILMLSAQESESLAIWALRNRVWDYLRKPVTGRDLAIRVARLRALLEAGRTRPSRALITPEPANVTAAPAGNTAPALGYIDDHYQEKILLDQVAGECGMGRFEFSRAFKREQGVTFREFVANYRILRSLELFGDPSVSIIQVALAVGFGDPSHFTRTFRRYVGVTPSLYRAGKEIT